MSAWFRRPSDSANPGAVAANSGVAIGRDNFGQINTGLDEEGVGRTLRKELSGLATAGQVEQLVKAEREGVIQQYTSQLIDLAKQLGEKQGAVRAMLRQIGHDDIPAERLTDTLAAVATQFLAMRQALSRPTNDEAIAELRRQAVMALDARAHSIGQRAC